MEKRRIRVSVSAKNPDLVSRRRIVPCRISVRNEHETVLLHCPSVCHLEISFTMCLVVGIGNCTVSSNGYEVHSRNVTRRVEKALTRYDSFSHD